MTLAKRIIYILLMDAESTISHQDLVRKVNRIHHPELSHERILQELDSMRVHKNAESEPSGYRLSKRGKGVASLMLQNEISKFLLNKIHELDKADEQLASEGVIDTEGKREPAVSGTSETV